MSFARFTIPAKRLWLLGCLGAVALTLLGKLATAAKPKARPATQCVGAPNAGRLRHARLLQARDYLRLRHGDDGDTWGHPLLLQLIDGAARAVARKAPGAVVLVGDLSSQRGGKLPGHRSHQTGRDADVAYMLSDPNGSVRLKRFEKVDSWGRSLRTPNRVFDVRLNWVLLAHWLEDLRVPVRKVFVSKRVRQRLLDFAEEGSEFGRLRKRAKAVLRVAPNHADHFHLRISCPPDQSDCQDDSNPR